MTSEWRPVSVRASGEETRFDVLHEGVPDWMRRPLVDRLTITLTTWSYAFTSSSSSSMTSAQAESKVVQELELALRVRFSGPSVGYVIDDVSHKADLALDLLDCLMTHELMGPDGIEATKYMLQRAGSAWDVVQNEAGGAQLVRRVPEPVMSAVEEVFIRGDAVSRHISSAFRLAYGRDPHAGAAYQEAVKAVESAGATTILPDDLLATLGKMIRAIRDKPLKWRCVLRPDDPKRSMEQVAEAMELLWKGQHDRHGEGTVDPNAQSSSEMSLEEAQAALYLAITIAIWFQQGAIVRIDE